MALFNCPSCKRELSFVQGSEAFQICRYCGGKIIVPSVIIHQADIEKVDSNSAMAKKQREQMLFEVQSSLNAGRKIEAVTLFREAFGSDLSTAKSAIEALETGGPLPSNLTPVAYEKPIEDRIYSGAQANQAPASRGVSVFFWLIIILGIMIASFLLRN